MMLPIKPSDLRFGMLLAIALAFGCAHQSSQSGQSDYLRAEQLIAGINTMMEQEDKAAKAVPVKYQGTFSRENLARLPLNRRELKDSAVEMVSYLDASYLRYRRVANDFAEVSKLRVDDNLKEYASLQSSIFDKDAEYRSVSKERISLVLDESIKDAKNIMTKLDHIDERIRRIQEERNQLHASAISPLQRR